MNTFRRGVLAVGLVLVGGGLAVVIAPNLAGGLNPSTILVNLVGVLALLAGLAGVRARMKTETRRADLPEPERRTATAVPGDDADDRLEDLSIRAPYRLRTGYALRERVRAAAMDVLASEGYTETDAAAALASGAWTDDPYAAAFLTDEPVDLPVWVRARDAINRESGVRLQARHAIDALADRSDAASPTSADGTPDSTANQGLDGDGDPTDTDDGTTDAPLGHREGAS